MSGYISARATLVYTCVCMCVFTEVNARICVAPWVCRRVFVFANVCVCSYTQPTQCVCVCVSKTFTIVMNYNMIYAKLYCTSSIEHIKISDI